MWRLQFALQWLTASPFLRCLLPRGSLASACPGRLAQGEGSLASPSSLSLSLPAGLAEVWREGVPLFLPRLTATGTSRLSSTWTQPAAPAMDRWYLGESPKPHPSRLLRLRHRCPPHYFPAEPPAPRSAGEAGFLNKGSSVRSSGHTTVHPLGTSELQELAGQFAQ